MSDMPEKTDIAVQNNFKSETLKRIKELKDTEKSYREIILSYEKIGLDTTTLKATLDQVITMITLAEKQLQRIQ